MFLTWKCWIYRVKWFCRRDIENLQNPSNLQMKVSHHHRVWQQLIEDSFVDFNSLFSIKMVRGNPCRVTPFIHFNLSPFVGLNRPARKPVAKIIWHTWACTGPSQHSMDSLVRPLVLLHPNATNDRQSISTRLFCLSRELQSLVESCFFHSPIHWQFRGTVFPDR
jgi:hypothetical protein